MDCFGLVKKGWAGIPNIMSMLLTTPWFGFSNIFHIIHPEERAMAMGIMKTDRNALLALPGMRTDNASSREIRICSGVVMRLNTRVTLSVL